MTVRQLTAAVMIDDGRSCINSSSKRYHAESHKNNEKQKRDNCNKKKTRTRKALSRNSNKCGQGQ